MRTTALRFWLPVMLLWIGSACGGDTPNTPSDPALVSVTLTVEDQISRPVAGARVELLHPADAGTFRLTGADGRVTLTGHVEPAGPVGRVRVRITKDGFKDATPEFAIPLNAKTFTDRTTVTYATFTALSGGYSLRLEAASTCSNLPEVARVRTYSATMTPKTGAGWPENYFDVALSGTFFHNSHVIGAASVGNDGVLVDVRVPALLALDPINIQWDEMAERAAANAWVTVSGTGKAALSGQAGSFSGSLEGRVSYCPTEPNPLDEFFACPVQAVNCDSTSHRITLTRLP